jgi:hypothetical protein
MRGLFGTAFLLISTACFARTTFRPEIRVKRRPEGKMRAGPSYREENNAVRTTTQAA